MAEFFRYKNLIFDTEEINQHWYAILWKKCEHIYDKDEKITYFKFIDSAGPFCTDFGATRGGCLRLVRLHCIFDDMRWIMSRFQNAKDVKRFKMNTKTKDLIEYDKAS